MSNNLFEILEIERGITADEFEANDDPGKITSPVWGLGFRIYFDFFFCGAFIRFTGLLHLMLLV